MIPQYTCIANIWLEYPFFARNLKLSTTLLVLFSFLLVSIFAILLPKRPALTSLFNIGMKKNFSMSFARFLWIPRWVQLFSTWRSGTRFLDTIICIKVSFSLLRTLYLLRTSSSSTKLWKLSSFSGLDISFFAIVQRSIYVLQLLLGVVYSRSYPLAFFQSNIFCLHRLYSVEFERVVRHVWYAVLISMACQELVS